MVEWLGGRRFGGVDMDGMGREGGFVGDWG